MNRAGWQSVTAYVVVRTDLIKQLGNDGELQGKDSQCLFRGTAS